MHFPSIQYISWNGVGEDLMDIFKGLELGWHAIPNSQKQGLMISKISFLFLKCVKSVTVNRIKALKPILC